MYKNIFALIESLRSSRLDGDVCTTYGLRVTHVGSDGNATSTNAVCNINQLITGELDPPTDSTTAHIDLWHEPGAVFRARCYFWCTSTGGLPERGAKGATLDQELVDTLVGFIQNEKSTRRVKTLFST